MLKSTITDGHFPICARAFGTYKPDELLGFAPNVITKVTGDPLMAGIKPAVAAQQAAFDDFSAKNAAAKNRGKMEILQRKMSQKVLVTGFGQWANFIDTAADGVLAVIIGSGFDARRAPGTGEIPSIPTNLRTRNGANSGEAVVACTGGRNIRNFSPQYAEAPEGPWIDRPLSTKSNVLFPGLTPGKTYWFRLKANGAKGSSDWSSPISKMAV